LTRLRTTEEKVGDWAQAFNLVAPELTPAKLRTQLDAVINTPIPQDPEGILVYTQRMNASLALARLIAANDRAAGTIAALLVQSGIKPAAIDYGDDT
jgi:hypothetical protein